MEKDEIVIGEILVAAKSLFAKFGLKKTTIEDISIAANKGKSTLYYYFPGKNEIFEAVVKYELETVIRNLRENVSAVHSAKDKLRAFLTIQGINILELRSLYKVLFEDILESRRMLMPLRLKYEQIQIEMITEILSGGVISGEFKNLSAENIKKLSFFMIIAFRGLHYPLSINPAEIQSQEYFDELIDMLIEGIGN
ncbi:TetR/AcrR family transcriptional regulator [Pedobacter sp. L105]|uniref:TetR/AcrR family transcriptional regulator n=1 Tax=Pedobacter sp. L105 TaxID=1641871 RepID=UPI00131E02C8|nr:TetR/AcrR family transcriptional regulator [Pedobacter sp. L105]